MPAVSSTTDIYQKERCRDWVMNEFLFWCVDALVRLLFHEVTSLHPHSFQRNYFFTCIIYIEKSARWYD